MIRLPNRQFDGQHIKRGRTMKKNLLTLSLSIMALTAVHQARAENIASLSLGFNALRYELIDLDANDGITPSITFTDGQFHFLATDDYLAGDARQSLAGTLFGSATGQADSQNSHVSFGGGSMRASTAMDSDKVADLATPLPSDGWTARSLVAATYADVVNSYGQEVMLSRPDFEVLPAGATLSSFTLSPQTRLVVKAQAFVDAQVNLDALGAGALRQGVQQGLIDAELGVGGLLELGLYDAQGDEVDALAYGPALGQILDQNGVRFGDHMISTNVIQDSAELEFSFVNDSAQTKDGAIYARVEASTALGLGTVAVPEPGSWALMALGLAGMCPLALARQRKKQQAAG
jgi:PEP-CTERM motif